MKFTGTPSGTSQNASAGYFRNGMPFNRLGHGARSFIVFQGLMFENKPQPGLMSAMYKFLGDAYTVYSVLRKPGLPAGYSLKNMADDYATMIREEFGGPVDVIGISTGGSIVQHFAADHPDLVRRLVIHSSAHALSDAANRMQLECGRLAQQGRWWSASAMLTGYIFPRIGIMKYVTKPIHWLVSTVLALGAPKDATDLVVTVEAEAQHHFKNRLAEIKAPTLVIAGAQDPFYSASLFQETAAGIPNANLILYPKMGHPAGGKQFELDVLAFLTQE